MAAPWILLPLFGCFLICQAQDSISIDYNSQNDLVPDDLDVWEDLSWEGLRYLNQVSGLSVDDQGNLHIFHRADRFWDQGTFNKDNTLNDTAQGPITQDTIIVMNPVEQRILYTWGANVFYVPHGLNIGTDGHTYVTDVGLHQVMRFIVGKEEPDLVLGTALVPGNDRNHFCKPSDALVDNGHIFISDGYCNRRVVTYSYEGNFIGEYGVAEHMRIPHTLALAPVYSSICVTDREDDRILCFSTGGDGTPIGQIKARLQGQGLRRVFAADVRGKTLFAVNGPELFPFLKFFTADHGVAIDMDTGLGLGVWGPEKGFLQPHDIAISPDGNNIYVCELDNDAPKKVYKFHIRG